MTGEARTTGSSAGRRGRRLVQDGKLTRLGAAALALVAVVVAAVVWQVIVMLHRPLLTDDFSRPNGLITNEFAYFNPHDPAAVRSPAWVVTSGSLYARDGTGWTGVPDRGLTGPRSATRTDSSVFRVVTRRSDFTDVTVSFALFLHRFMPVPGVVAPGWQGVHVFMRYQSPDLLYVVSIDRRDGVIVIKKKVPGGDTAGGTYYTLASVGGQTVVGRWVQVRVSAVNKGAGVTMKVWLNGRLRLQAVDNGVGDQPPITEAGRVGLRGDYTEFNFDNFTVTSA
jgi:hypothetical protein